MTRDARTSIFALKLIGPAGDIVTSLRRFVRTIRTILLTIAHPGLVDASNTIVAIELLVAMANFLFVRKFLASYFVGSIGTIIITVASPSRRYAIILGTREISARMTSCRPTSFLIAVIPAIVIVVAHPELLDTVLIRTGELVRSASVVALSLV